MKSSSNTQINAPDVVNKEEYKNKVSHQQAIIDKLC